MASIIPATALSAGSSTSTVQVNPDNFGVSLQFSSTEVVGSTAVLAIIGENGVLVLPLITISGTGSKIFNIPVQTGSVFAIITCTAGSCSVSLNVPTAHASTHADGGSDDLVGQRLSTKGIAGAFQSVTASGAGTTVNLANGFNVHLDLNASTTLTFTNPRNGERYFFTIVQGGSFTLAWPSIKWKGGSPPVITTGAGKIDVVCLMYDSVSGYLADVAQDFS
jgi:hypothetical protein